MHSTVRNTSFIHCFGDLLLSGGGGCSQRTTATSATRPNTNMLVSSAQLIADIDSSYLYSNPERNPRSECLRLPETLYGYTNQSVAWLLVESRSSPTLVVTLESVDTINCTSYPFYYCDADDNDLSQGTCISDDQACNGEPDCTMYVTTSRYSLFILIPCAMISASLHP